VGLCLTIKKLLSNVYNSMKSFTIDLPIAYANIRV
jgi:hypothetical protein